MLERLGFDGTTLRVLEDALPWADSGVETYVRLRLGRIGLRVVPQVWILGYTVVRVSYAQLMHQWPEVQGRLLRAVAQVRQRTART